MSLTTDYIYNYILKLSRKNQSGGLPAEDFMFFWNGEQRSYFADLMGRFNRNTNSKLTLETGLIENETIMTKLNPFIKSLTNQPIVAGLGTKPPDFVWTLALRINGTKVFYINHDQIWRVNQDVIDPPSIADDSYYYSEYGNNYSFLPNTVTQYDLDYISSPPDIVWAYTYDINGRQVYDPSGSSVNPMWGNSDCSEIAQRAMKQLGVSFASQDFENFGQQTIAQGSA